GGRAPVAALVRLLSPLDIAAPAVRTAVSRMVRQGWLQHLQLQSGPGYVLTQKAARLLDEVAARSSRTPRVTWDGRFDLVVTTTAVPRRQQQRLAAELAFRGYGVLDNRTWVAPRAAADVDAVLTEAQVHYERFTAAHAAGDPGAARIISRAWDLPEIGRAYERFVAEQQPLLQAVTARSSDEQAYAARFRLVHAWRGFLFRDPHLPAALLPDRWPGTAAAAFFDRHATRLRPAADRYVAHCLDQATHRR
ncbi:MAG TPA: PaaX family transcriptional regulator C-terminal domain-containing protein, partial [Actinoplanes sp.]|nr:PaaX family transcriptional regulator C-terminal domain-containing protein [Actinoplanes sp.]